MKIDSVHAEFMSGNAVSSTTSSHSIVSRDASGDIAVAGVSIVGNSGTLFRYGNGTSNVYGGSDHNEPWFGTSSDNDLRLVTNGNERVRLDKTGKVGIGTSSPSHALNVTATSGDAEVHIQAQGNAGDSILYFNGASENQRKCAIISSNVAPASYCKQDLHFCMETTNDLSNVVITDSKMVLTNAGNVGIGTMSPHTIFHTHSSFGADEVWVDEWKHSFDANWNFRLSQRHDAAVNVEYGFKQRYNTVEYSPITFRGSTIELSSNVGIGTASPRCMLDIYTASTAIPGLIIDRAPSGTYRSELYQGSDGLVIKVGDGTNAPTENMRITSSTTATPGKLTVGSGTASGSQLFVYAPGNNSTTANTDLHVTPNGQMIMYGTRPWVTTTNTQGTLDRQCYIALHSGGHQPAIEWVRNNSQGTNQRNWLLRQETADALYLWHYNGSAWGTPFVFKEDGKLGVGTASPTVKLDVVGGNIGLDYGRAIEVSPSMAASWPSGTTKLIETGWGTGDEVRFFTPGSQSSTQKMVINSNGRVGIGLGNPGNTLDVRGGVAVSYADGNAIAIDGGGTVRRHYIYNSVDYGAGLHFTSNAIFPTDYAGGYNNGGIDWGSPTYRWNNIYAVALNTTSAATFGSYIHVANPTSTTNSPYSTGIDVYNSGSGDCTLALRCNNTSTGSSFVSFDNATQQGWSFGMDGSDSNKIKLAGSWSDLSSSTKLTVKTNGFVGIGITNPDVPLHVTNTTSTSVGDTHRWVTINAISGGGSYNNKFGGALSDTTGGNYTYSIKTVGAISSPRFIIGSDERIKKDIVDVEDDEALVKLRMLHPKKYRFIDESERGAHQIYGFLANEVKEVLPDAIVEHSEEVPSIYQFANATSSNVITFNGDFNTSQLESNVLVVVGVDQVKHTLTVDEIIDSTSVRVVEDLSAFSGSLDEHGNVVTETQTLSITPEEYDELEDKDGFKPISDESNVITEYTKTTTTYVGDQLFVYGEVVDDFKHLQETAISTLSTSALQEVDRQLQAEKIKTANLTARVEELEAMVSIIKLNMTWPDA